MSDDADQQKSEDLQENQSATRSRSASVRKRYNVTSTETGESSKRNSTVEHPTHLPDERSPGTSDGPGGNTGSNQDGRGSRRNHKNRNSGGFLLSNAMFEPPLATSMTTNTTSAVPLSSKSVLRENKGKVPVRGQDTKHMKNRSTLGTGNEGSPLAAVMNAENDAGNGSIGGDAAHDTKTGISGLDVDSAQIVNLALNLSESRRNATRRKASLPLPPTLTGFAEGFAGGSLRQHLQMQRRASRNVSPKPERGDPAFTASARTQADRMNSPLQGTFEHEEDGNYHYQFSASTLARAEKAKNAIELMAQYRRLLQYVPPLKLQPQVRDSTANLSASPSSSRNSGYSISRANSSAKSSRSLGRSYNPLQYIRNRKLRLRDRKPLDGEAQGFGDGSRVESWVDRVSQDSVSDGYHKGESVSLPPIMKTPDPKTPHHSPQSSLGGQAPIVKIRRPRVDWITNPADMLADIVWMERDGNKNLVEDSHGRRIFPQTTTPIRPTSRENYFSEPDVKVHDPPPSISFQTELFGVNPLQNGSENDPESPLSRPLSRAHDKLQEGMLVQSNTAGSERQALASQPGRRSQASDSEGYAREFGRHQKNNEDGDKLGNDILEKQMMEMLVKEASNEDQNNVRSLKSQDIGTKSLERNSQRRGDHESSTGQIVDGHRRTDSGINGGSQPPSGRASLEVPFFRGRSSLDGMDSSAPNSPQHRASKILNTFIPRISMDLSPPHSRRGSPTRVPALERVRSTIHLLRERSRDGRRDSSVRRNSAGQEDDQDTSYLSPGSPLSPDRTRRSLVPTRKPDGNIKSLSHAPARKDEEPSVVRALFKNRASMGRAGDRLGRKEGSAASSSDDSDMEDNSILSKLKRPSKVSKTSSREPSGDLQSGDLSSPDVERASYFGNLPAFESTAEARRRSGRPDISETSPVPTGKLSQRQTAREERRRSRFNLLKPPPINVRRTSFSSSPESVPFGRSSRNSDVSDLETAHRDSTAFAVRAAELRLNSVLGLPGTIPRNSTVGITITGLSSIEPRRPSLVASHAWPVADLDFPARVLPTTKHELSRVRALLLSSGVKAKEITRRASSPQSLDRSPFSSVAMLAEDPDLMQPIPRSQTHLLAARIVSSDIQLSARIWQDAADAFSAQAVSGLLDSIEELQTRITGRDGMIEICAQAADEADEVSRDLGTARTLTVKALGESMENMMRRRRRRFRRMRRVGWVMLEWALVGILWWVWFIVVLIKGAVGTVKGVIRGVRWLIWL